MRKLLFLISILLLCLQAFPQMPFGETIHWLSGYNKSMAGEPIHYTSVYPDYVNQALLTRATTGNMAIEWETDMVPQNVKGKYVYFRWVAAHSTGTSKGDRNFDLYINGDKALTFTTHPGNQLARWHFAAADSTWFGFVRGKTDGANDAHGIAYLRVPIESCKPGQPLTLKIVGQRQESRDWFMTFEYSFEERADIMAMPFLLRKGGQPLQLNLLHFGDDDRINVAVNGVVKKTFSVKEGMNTFEIVLPEVRKKDTVEVKVTMGKKVLLQDEIALAPIISREIHFIHHSHTDIGYSHMQPEVARIQTKNIRDAIALIEKTRDYPDAARFRWNVESIWAVENFLGEATPEEVKKFEAAVKSGSICLSALYANLLTGLSMPEEMFHYTDYADSLSRRFGFNIESAMMTDIPGATWSLVTALAKNGVKYFSSGPNFIGQNSVYQGDRVGAFVNTWGDRPVWWASPSGKEKILFWTAGKGYSSWHGNAPGAIFKNGARRIALYMDELSDEGYPYDLVQWRYNIMADNGMVDSTISDFVKYWNEKYRSPKIILSTVDRLFSAFEKKYGKDLPVVRGDITPYWDDGAASTAFEEGMTRNNSLRLQQLTTLYALLNPGGYDRREFYEAWKNILLFHEHTWGAHNSISDPDIPFVTGQWQIKKSFAYNADSLIDRLTTELLQRISGKASQQIAVINTLSWPRSGPVWLPEGADATVVVDSNGKEYPLQVLSDGRKVFISPEIPPIGIAYFWLKNDVKTITPSTTLFLTDSSMGNGKILLKWNKPDGSIAELLFGGFDFASDYEGMGLNSYWYVPGLDPADAENNGEVTIIRTASGPYLNSIVIKTAAPGTRGLNRKISLWAGADQVMIEDVVDKLPVRTKEGVYFAFPFSKELNQVSWDGGYGTVRFLKDQLPGSNMDFVSPRRWLDASSSERGIQLLMKEAFMAAPDSMVNERPDVYGNYKRWRDTAYPTSLWWSYVMNNYWHTNFKIDQGDRVSFHYALRPHGPLNPVLQEKAAMEFTMPLITVPIPATSAMDLPEFSISNDKVVVTSITPQPDGTCLIRLFNPDFQKQQVEISWKGNKSSIEMPGMAVKEVEL